MQNDIFTVENPDRYRWTLQVLCAELDSLEPLFVLPGQQISEDTKEICRHCPVRKQCLELALLRDAPAGYFGGFSQGERARMTLSDVDRIIAADPPRLSAPPLPDPSRRVDELSAEADRAAADGADGDGWCDQAA